MWLTQYFLEDLLSKVLASLWRDYWYSYHSSWTPRPLYFHCLLQITRVSPQANNSLACLSVCANSISFEVFEVTSGLKGHLLHDFMFYCKMTQPSFICSALKYSCPLAAWLQPFRDQTWSMITSNQDTVFCRQLACQNAGFRPSCQAYIGSL